MGSRTSFSITQKTTLNSYSCFAASPHNPIKQSEECTVNSVVNLVNYTSTHKICVFWFYFQALALYVIFILRSESGYVKNIWEFETNEKKILRHGILVPPYYISITKVFRSFEFIVFKSHHQVSSSTVTLSVKKFFLNKINISKIVLPRTLSCVSINRNF